jgi:hypothetical protein
MLMTQLSTDPDTFRSISVAAMRKLINFDLDRLDPVEFASMRAAFQSSDPILYPETDPVLKVHNMGACSTRLTCSGENFSDDL